MEHQPNPIEPPDVTPENAGLPTDKAHSAPEKTTSPFENVVLPNETAFPVEEAVSFTEKVANPTVETTFSDEQAASATEKTAFPSWETVSPSENFTAPPPPPPAEVPPVVPIQGEVVRPALPKEKSNLFLRVVTALIGIPIVAGLVWHIGPTTFNLVIAILALLSLRELGGALRQGGFALVRGLAYPALLVLLFAQRFTAGGSRAGALLIWILPFVLLIGLLVEGVLRYPRQQRLSLQSIALTLLSTLYAGLFVFVILLRALTWPDFAAEPDFSFTPPGEAMPQLGPSLLWLTLIAVWSGDTVAYFAGRMMGKEKLTPLSPGKTWEGAVAGLTATIAVCVPMARLLEIELRHGLALGVLIALAAPLGDLAESFWKRELGVKDLGGCLPGHGGILDRCDSLLFAVFAVYIYAQLLLVG